MPKHPDTQKRESYVLSRAMTVIRRKYNEEYLGYLAEARARGLGGHSCTSDARMRLRKAHTDEYNEQRIVYRDQWNALFPELAKSIDQRTTNNAEIFAERNKPGRGMKKHLNIPNKVYTPEEAERIIRDNYRWIQQKRGRR